MVRQHLEKRPDNLLDSDAMAAGERAIGALAEFGYMEKVVVGRTFGRWTEAGEALLDWAIALYIRTRRSRSRSS
ncbi:hypothetical protein N8E89_22905 (plasmid) [Phyllobacterium sp. A18/5-2]|uniref:hypothetical protein n=1 Tax=Phyllobacterium sp. A18/5-2 TaxID=2978392 RepID=UPI0021C59EF2|nr:hypothetical protein [Phyllobacterium sp. A18/5-2]UXN66074.1 hypothetical protein N8E89_22905 [Phyllobacterium sp. A18/5-2]